MTITYLLTGANRGIGFEMSKAVLTSGNRLIALCRHPESASDLRALIQDADGRGEIYGADVCDEKALDTVASQIDRCIDVVVCNAGVMSPRGGLTDEQNTADRVATVLMTNIAGPFFTARAFLKNLRHSQHPKIAIISSMMGSQRHESGSAYFYRASKAGVNNVMVTLANELKSQGIAVASYHPGWVQTDMGGSAADIPPALSASELIQRFDELSLASTGAFLNYDGSHLPL